MRSLDSSATAVPQFVALCLVTRNTSADTAEGFVYPEPMVLPSPLATISSVSMMSAIRELKDHVSSSLEVLTSKDSSIAANLLREEAIQASLIQVYRPFSAEGLGLHYRFIKDISQLKSLYLLLVAEGRGGCAESFGNKNMDIPFPLLGALFCVGISGQITLNDASRLQYTLPQRISDSITFLLAKQANEIAAIKAVLSMMLLIEDEQRESNQMAETPYQLLFQAAKVDERPPPSLALMSPLAGTLNIRRMAGKEATVTDTVKKDVELNRDTIAVEKGVNLSIELSGCDLAKIMDEQLKVLAVAEDDTQLRKYKVSLQERKANLDLAGSTKSRFSRRKNTSRGTLRDPDLDHFDYKGPAKNKETQAQMTTPAVLSPVAMSTKKDMGSVKGAFPALNLARTDGHGRRSSLSSMSSAGHRSRESRRTGARFVGGDDETQASGVSGNILDLGRRRSNGNNFEDNVSRLSDNREPLGRLQVNIALNEDLSCSYKLSQLASCNVEGVVQVQVRTSGRATGPFLLIIRDPSHHIEMLQENKRFAEDLDRGHENDFKYAVSIPKGDSYTPVIRYKCVDKLRPVPLRVQTRVKLDGEHCRVALQISSNPNNEASLADLTIIMGVPDGIVGESLVTLPEGGVWNASKRSVIWCVSELGRGEKFQLQARFELERRSKDIHEEKPKFPVLIRSQCLFAQLSNVEIDVLDIPEVLPADIEMKVARRFRVAHRER